MTQRQTKTAAQRAQEALDVADRRIERLRADAKKHEEAAHTAVRALKEAVRRRDYLAANPDLPQTGMGVPTPPSE